MPRIVPRQSLRRAPFYIVICGLALAAAILFWGAGAEPSQAGVIVNPGPASGNASIWSEISFRGVSPGRSGRITVRGSRSGRHGFVRKRHSDARGFSLILKRPLAVSEYVRVSTGLNIYGAKRGNFRFRTENLRFPRSQRVKPVRRPVAGRAGYVTRPNLKPPVMKVDRNDARASDLPLFVGSKAGGNVIYRADGEPVWFRPGITMDFRTQRWRGRRVLTWIEVPTRGSGLKRTTYMIADPAYRIIRKLTPGNGYPADTHEFRLTPRGTAFVTAYRTRIRDLRKVGQSRRGRVSDSIAQEIDLRTGRVIWEWHSLDHVPVTDTYSERPRRSGSPFDYFHINTVADTPDGNVLISGRSTSTVYKVSRRTGRVMWRLGGRRSSFRMKAGTRFSWQHDSQALGGGRISLYDNSDSPVTSRSWGRQSSGLILKLNRKKRTARLVRRFHHPDRPLASTQGNVQSLAGGHRLVGWGGVPLISEYGPEGNLLFSARVEGVSSFYRAYRGAWRAKPGGHPRLVSRRMNSAGKTRFWVSHNGDTQTHTWRVFAGPARNRLGHLADRVRDGFETAAVVPGTAPYIQVRGVDAEGKPTGRSPVVRVQH